MRLSQGHLNLLEACPRKFQHVFLDQLGLPVGFDQQAQLNWGSRFHLVMQQQELGLPLIASEHDQPLYACVQAFMQAAPELFQAEPQVVRQSEHRRNLALHDYLLTVVYDLLILRDSQAQILDWKTYQKPRQVDALRHHWQTKLYLFVLAETSHYLPEQLSMTYWFVQAAETDTQPPQPQSIHFQYSRAWHAQIRQELTQRLMQLTEWLARYKTGEPFPQVTTPEGVCSSCGFALRCLRSPETHEPQPVDIPSLSEIEEIVV